MPCSYSMRSHPENARRTETSSLPTETVNLPDHARPAEAARGRERAGESAAQENRDGCRCRRRGVRVTAAEKREGIRLVEDSELSARRTLRELQIPPPTFYRWYRRYRADGLEGLTPQPSAARRHWNRMPPAIRHGRWACGVSTQSSRHVSRARYRLVSMPSQRRMEQDHAH